jgi:hypothetical protein
MFLSLVAYLVIKTEKPPDHLIFHTKPPYFFLSLNKRNSIKYGWWYHSLSGYQ